jgi:hypothetical protein
VRAHVQKFIAVTSPHLSAPPGKLMRMPGEARMGESETAAESYPIIVRAHEPVADLDDRLQTHLHGAGAQ